MKPKRIESLANAWEEKAYKLLEDYREGESEDDALIWEIKQESDTLLQCSQDLKRIAPDVAWETVVWMHPFWFCGTILIVNLAVRWLGFDVDLLQMAVGAFSCWGAQLIGTRNS